MIPDHLEAIKQYLPNTPLEQLHDPWLEQYKINLFIKRDDLIHQQISGNKFRKLKYALIRYAEADYSGIVSFGGPWSNHLHALSAVTEKYNIPFIAIVRGEEPTICSATLKDIQQSGASVHYVSRHQYRAMRTASEQGQLLEQPLLKQWSEYLIIPEGGCSADALPGVAEIIAEDQQEFDTLYLACGTATTLAGLNLGLNQAQKINTKLIGIAALRAGDSLQQNVQRLLAPKINSSKIDWRIDTDFHFGGFAKVTPQLIEFIKQFHQRTAIMIEPVYTGKALFALYQHIEQGHFATGSNIMFLHTGGLQGLRGFQNASIGLAK